LFHQFAWYGGITMACAHWFQRDTGVLAEMVDLGAHTILHSFTGLKSPVPCHDAL
jgi:hypothetical protein